MESPIPGGILPRSVIGFTETRSTFSTNGVTCSYCWVFSRHLHLPRVLIGSSCCLRVLSLLTENHWWSGFLLIENCFNTIHLCMWLNTNYLPTRLTTKLLSYNASNLLIYNTFTGQQSKPYITITEECNLISEQVHMHTWKWGYVVY